MFHLLRVFFVILLDLLPSFPVSFRIYGFPCGDHLCSHIGLRDTGIVLSPGMKSFLS